METDYREFSGKKIGPDELNIIKWAAKTYKTLSRRELAATICECIDWVTTTGTPKLPQCVSCLEKLEEEGLIKLPPKQKSRKPRSKNNTSMNESLVFDTSEISDCDLNKVELRVLTRIDEKHKYWREYLIRYHMLGYKQVFGAQLNYLITCEGRDLGGIQFSASSWALEPREKWIGWSLENRKKHLNLIINNSRFLILPWVKVKNLASKVLSLAIKQIQSDWLKIYCYEPVLLETFVEKDKFKGTCYKAGNWILIGQTKGRSRMDRHNNLNLPIKDIYMYPLQKDFKEILKGEKEYKRVNPDE